MKKLSFLILICFASITMLHAQISGTVYRDFNGNGVRQTAAPNNEPGVPGVIVNAYDASNTLVSTTISSATGAYSMPYTVPVRVEFEIPSGNICANSEQDYTGFSGDGNNIRFVNGSTSTLNYAIHLPDDYTADTNPFVYVPIFTMGDPLGGGTSGTSVGFVGYTYNSTTTASSAKTLP